MLPVLLLVASAAAAVVDWWAVGGDVDDGHGGVRRSAPAVERVAKPVTMLLLTGVAATWGDAPGDVRTWLVAGALLGVVGDVALLGSGEAAFMVGLSAFALGHLAYAVAAAQLGLEVAWTVPGALVMIALLGYRFVPHTVTGAHRAGGGVLAGAVVGYAAVIATMVIAAWGTGRVVAAVGASLFAVSDWVLGHRRFVGPLPGGRLAVMVPYHVGQAFLILGLAA